ncbi:MAG: hypothetical protein KDD62_13465, partial [Bdellovibrionales bacterium]|nr:hypothetical protein [Bdellovibrionales bacterium]
MSLPEVKDQVVLVEPSSARSSTRKMLIEKYVGDAKVQAFDSVEALRLFLEKETCDVLILDNELLLGTQETLLQELKLLDCAPGVVMLAKNFSPQQISDLYNAGCSRCVIDDGQDNEEIGLTVRHMIRVRRLEEENRKLIAKLTEANALLSEKNKRLDEFSGTVAHDIRGPLGGICMRLEYMRDVYQDDLDGRFRELLEASLSSSRRLIDVVQAMYEFAKLGSQAQVLKEIPLNDFVEEVIQDLVFDDRLDIQVGIDELPIVYANPGLLRKVFLNLLSNAIKYNDKRKIVINIGVNA